MDNISVNVSETQMTYEYIQMTYHYTRVHTSDIQMTYEWHTNDIQAYIDKIQALKSDIQMTCVWHTNRYDCHKK